MSPSTSEGIHYYGWIVSRINRYLGKNVLDIGSGNRTYLLHILPLVERVTSIDISQENVDFLNQRFEDCSQFRAICADFEQTPLPLWMKVSGFDTILCLNALEHVKDDLSALRHINALLPLGQGVLILQVPSHPGLYGSMDKQAGHFRRYRKSEIATRLEQTGYKILHIEYFNRLSTLFWWINGRLFRRRLDSRIVSFEFKIFDRFLVPVLKPLESLLPLPFGQSILVAAVKQREDYHGI
ncbi:MAG: class I SAM-dependent methyltransferase [Chloroflexi bacterium]|nr:class I SAM-dependent methyltransferase [Chloroflexota bacterium]